MRFVKPWLAGAIGLVIGGGAVALATDNGDTDPDRGAMEKVVREYILAHPEIIPEAMDRLRARETAKMLADNRHAIEAPFAGAWAGAKDGDVTLVMFSDYSCGFCRASLSDVDRLLGEDRRLKVVWRELPVLGPGSDTAARASLAAATQGKYLDFHRRMFAAGPPDDASVARISRAVGLAPASGSAPAFDAEIERNITLARKLGVAGTPAWVVGDKLLSGAVGYQALKTAIAEARSAKG